MIELIYAASFLVVATWLSLFGVWAIKLSRRLQIVEEQVERQRQNQKILRDWGALKDLYLGDWHDE